ncbi:MAG: CueP family metal-binding protein [Deltaproteobacteria bacterium]|nr:CueP family metal-binding protein [Deltaproteobacteria bacterium]
MPYTMFAVKAVDRNGEVLVDSTVETLRNGFFELWLPRNRRILLTIRADGRSAVGMIGTFDDSKTCITTFRLR